MNARNSTTQTDNTAGGDLVGGDKVINAQSTHVHLPSPGAIRRLGKLIERLKEEEMKGNGANGIIDELLRFTEPKEIDPIGVEAKLTDGGRVDLIEFALEAKQRFYMKLAKNTFFESAQEIHAFVLSWIYTVFSTEIIPKIRSGVPAEVIDDAIQTKVIIPVVAELQETAFRYYDEHVYGMLFYLTGNCYVKWV